MICSTGTPAYAGRKLREVNNSPPAAFYPHGLSAENDGHIHNGITERYADFGRSQITVPAVAEETTALLPNVFVVLQTDIPHSYRGLHMPTLSDTPHIPVRKSHSEQRTFVTPRPHSQPLDTSGIKVGIDEVGTDKVPGKPTIGPEPNLGLNHPELELPIVRISPGIIPARHLQRNTPVQPDFESRIEGCRRPVKRIGLHRETRHLPFRSPYRLGTELAMRHGRKAEEA